MPPDIPDFSRRATAPELMDLPCSYEDFRACLRNLKAINLVTLGYRPTLRWLERLLPAGRSLHIVDVGCGGGDMLRHIERWAKSRNVAVRLTGIDLNPYAARAAREFASPGERIEWITGDAFAYPPHESIDVVISSLFAHHLADDEIVRFLSWMEARSRYGWFINDLHRQPRPYQLFRLLAKVARYHRFVQHDGPLSILRSFSHSDWQHLCQRAGIQHAQVETFRPGRLCVGRRKTAQVKDVRAA